METTIPWVPARATHTPTDVTLSIGGLPSLGGGTPWISDLPIDAPAAPLLAGSDVLVRSRRQDILMRLLTWWKLDAPGMVVTASLPPPARTATLSALDAARQLMELLGLTMDSLATAAGLGRTTILHWQRVGSSPRPSTVERLWRLYALSMALRADLGVAGTQAWMRSGTVSPLSHLMSGDFAAFESVASRQAFTRRPERAFEPSFAVNPDVETEQAPQLPAARARRVRPRRMQEE